MITDKLCNLARYRGISGNIDRAIGFLSSERLSELAVGRTDVAGDEIYINRFEYETSDEPGSFENHKKHLDLHIPLAGEELIVLSPTEPLCERSYNEEDDSQELTGEAVSTIRLSHGEFALIFPGEAHIPKLSAGRPTAVSKLVVKILWDR